MRIDFSLCRAQSDAIRLLEPHNRVANAWGRGVGKSYFDRCSLYIDVARHDGVARRTLDGELFGIRQVLLMPTFKQFKRVHASSLLSDLSPRGKWGFLGAKVNQTDWRTEFPGGSWIQVVSAVNADDNRGIRCDKVIADECDDIDIGTYESICVPWFSEPWSLDMRLLSGTPRRGRYGLLWRGYRVWPQGDADSPPVPNHYGLHATYKDAPDIVSARAVEEAKRTTNPATFAREWLCDFDSGEGLVYPFFNPEIHVRPPPNLSVFHEYIVGVDYGFNDPSVFLVIGVAGKGRDAVCHVVHERYMIGKSASELAAVAMEIEASWPGARWYADHMPSLTKEIKDKAHVNIVEAVKGPGSVEDGVSFVADTLFVREDEDGRRWAQLYIDPSCRHTIDEFGLYRRKRDPRNSERVLDDIDTSKNDHTMDATRYALFSHFGGVSRRLILG